MNASVPALPLRALALAGVAVLIGVALAFMLRGTDSLAHPTWEFAVAVVIGLDVLASALNIGSVRQARYSIARAGSIAFLAQISALVAGALIGLGVQRLAGFSATYVGLAVLGLFGVAVIREHLAGAEQPPIGATSKRRLTAEAAALASDFVVLGFALPALGLPLPVILAAVVGAMLLCSCVGLVAGRWAGPRLRDRVGTAAGVLFTVMAVAFVLERALF